MHWIRLVALGVVQGLTEFIPVSSSGHLVLLQQILGLEYEGITLEIAVHLGTLAAVLAVYWRDALKIGATVARAGWGITRGKMRFRDAIAEPSFYLGMSLLAASALTAMIALPLSSQIRGAFGSIRLVAAAWLVTGVILYWTRGRRPRGRLPSVGGTLLIGIFQALAVVPGISRSGSTIAAGLYSGLSREEAARYSFLLSVIAILGAGAVDIPAVFSQATEAGFWTDLFVATCAAGISGFFALRFVIRKVLQGQMHRFALYVWALAAAVLVWTDFSP
ncbi:MAG: undecaprenyl-diphosphate phosphatase [Bacillota bacterium]